MVVWLFCSVDCVLWFVIAGVVPGFGSGLGVGGLGVECCYFVCPCGCVLVYAMGPVWLFWVLSAVFVGYRACTAW